MGGWNNSIGIERQVYECRFHGGPLDGQIRAMPTDLPVYLMAVAKPIRWTAYDTEPSVIDLDLWTVEYRMERRWGHPVRGLQWIDYVLVEPTDEALRHHLRQETPASRRTRAGTPSARHAA